MFKRVKISEEDFLIWKIFRGAAVCSENGNRVWEGAGAQVW